MPSGPEMYRAVRQAVEDRRLEPGDVFPIHPLDALDLCKLTTADLGALGFDRELARRISCDLFGQGESYFTPDRSTELALGFSGVILRLDRTAPLLLAEEGVRRAVNLLMDDPQTLDEMLEELDAIRHPERQAR